MLPTLDTAQSWCQPREHAPFPCTKGAGAWMLRARVPAFSRSLHIIHAVTEVSSLGLAITVLPAATAGAIFQVSR